MTRNSHNTTRTRTMTLAALAIGAIIAITPGALAGQNNAPNKRTIAKAQASPARAQAVKQRPVARAAASPARDQRTSAQNGHQRAGAAHDRGQWSNRDRNNQHRDNDRSNWRGRDRNHDNNRDHDRSPGRWNDRDRDCEVRVYVPRVEVVQYRAPTPRCDVLGTFSINNHKVDVRDGQVFETLIEAARCAGYEVCKVKVNGRSYIRIYGCPEVCFEGYGYTMDVIRYHNNVIDIAIFRDDCR